MRRFIFSVRQLGVALIAVVLAACNVGSTNTIGSENLTKIEVALPQTRIALGEKAGENYPVYWSEGDRVAVNGVLSEAAEIDADNRSLAKFAVYGPLTYPHAVTYPYTSATTAEIPLVEFQSEQTYTQGSFAEGSVPMCGYVAGDGEAVAMKYLAGVLKFTIKASSEGTALRKVVVTSTSGAKLSGKFAVDCASATITAAENSGSKITYLLPSDYKLTTTDAAEFYISIPAVEVGNCTVEFVEPTGERMLCKWNPTTPVKSGVVREFKTITYKRDDVIEFEEVSLPSYNEGGQSRVFSLRAMSYNIHNCIGSDNVHDEQRTADVIRFANVDIVALQEIDSMTMRYPKDILKNLGEKTGMYTTFGAAIDYKGGKYGVGVLSKEKPLSYYTVPLPCSDEPRVLLVVELENYYFLCTHFSLLPEYQAEAVSIIAEAAAKLDKPVVLAGDLNAQRKAKSIQQLTEYFEIFEKKGSPYTYPAVDAYKEIDYICLYKGRGAMAVVKDSYVSSEDVASDHRPVIIDMTICE